MPAIKSDLLKSNNHNDFLYGNTGVVTLSHGDLDTLAWLCCPDFSDIKKKSFWWTGVAQEQIDRLLKHYE